MALSQEIQDFLLLVAFDFETHYYRDLKNKNELSNKYSKSENKAEGLYNFLKANELLESDDNIDIDKDETFKKDKLISYIWVINENIKIRMTYYDNMLLDCWVYQILRSINKQILPLLVGHYLIDDSVKFFNKPEIIISPYEFNGKIPAQIIAIALFYILNPKVFSPNWEKIAKKILGIKV